MKTVKLKRSFFARSTLEVAPELLGKLLVYNKNGRVLGGRLVEVEAYVGEDDPACHASCGKTPRNEIMYGPAGFLYVYFTYGNHYMLNIVTEREGFPAAVLIRGLEPLLGIERMMKSRKVEKITEIASGPGKLTRALGITTKQNGWDVVGETIYILDDRKPIDSIWCSSRIGIGDRGTDKRWRFYFDDNPHVSRTPVKIKKTGKRFG